MDNKERLKMAIIAGASHALKYKAQDWKSTDDAVLRRVAEEAEKILRNMDED